MRPRSNPDDIFQAAIDIVASGARDVYSDINSKWYVQYSQTAFAEYVIAAGLFTEQPLLQEVTQTAFTVSNKITRFLSQYDIPLRSTPVIAAQTTQYFTFRDVSLYTEVADFKPYIKEMING